MNKVLAIIVLLISNNIFAQCYDDTKNINNSDEVASIFKCFQAEINQLKIAKSTSVAVNTLPGMPDASISASETIKNVKFDLLSCNRNGSSLICNLVITSLDKERFHQMYEFKAFDELGSEYKSRTPFFEKGNKTHKQLMAKVPVRVKVEFNKFDKKATQLVKLKLRNTEGTIEYSHIAIK